MARVVVHSRIDGIWRCSDEVGSYYCHSTTPGIKHRYAIGDRAGAADAKALAKADAGYEAQVREAQRLAQDAKNRAWEIQAELALREAGAPSEVDAEVEFDARVADELARARENNDQDTIKRIFVDREMTLGAISRQRFWILVRAGLMYRQGRDWRREYRHL